MQVEYQSLGPVVVDIEKGMEDPLNIAPMLPAAWEYGDVDAAMASAAKVVQGRFRMGSQYHFHMEVGFMNSGRQRPPSLRPKQLLSPLLRMDSTWQWRPRTSIRSRT